MNYLINQIDLKIFITNYEDIQIALNIIFASYFGILFCFLSQVNMEFKTDFMELIKDKRKFSVWIFFYNEQYFLKIDELFMKKKFY